MSHPDIDRLVESLETLPPSGALAGSIGVEEVRAEDIARAISALDDATKILIVSLLSDDKAAAVLVETDDHTIEAVLEHLSPERIVRLLDKMDPDDAADIVDHAPDGLQPSLVAGLEEDQRRSVRALQEHEPESAGGVMTTEVVAVDGRQTVAEALAKAQAADQPEAIHTVFVVDAAGTLAGVVNLQELLAAPDDATVAEIMDSDVISVPIDADREEAARLVDRYHLASIPVVDAAGRLQGVITVDDVIEVLAEEASEDMLRLAGTSAVHPTTVPLLRRLRARAPWLGITLAGTFLASLLIEFIEQVLTGRGADPAHPMSTLLYFIPLVGGMAGNVGSQSAYTMVRGFATGEIDPKRPSRVLGTEMLLGLLIGLMAGLVVGILATIAFPDVPMLGWMVGIALPLSLLWAGVAGTLIPYGCHAVGVDPAYSAGPFLQTLNDLVAMAIYFSVALGLQRAFDLG